jgi:hypothetical protein
MTNVCEMQTFVVQMTNVCQVEQASTCHEYLASFLFSVINKLQHTGQDVVLCTSICWTTWGCIFRKYLLGLLCPAILSPSLWLLSRCFRLRCKRRAPRVTGGESEKFVPPTRPAANFFFPAHSSYVFHSSAKPVPGLASFASPALHLCLRCAASD